MATKEQNFKQNIFLTISIAVFAAIFVLLLGIFEILPVIAFIVLLILIFLFAGLATMLLFISERRRIKAILAKQRLEREARERKLKELYDLLGIEIQYNDDGSIKDLYQLLGIDKEMLNGVRQLTVYELLGLLPRFNENGIEIPNVAIIKNRVNKFAKGIQEGLVFTYKSKNKTQETEQQKKEGKSSSKKDTKPGAKKAQKKPLPQGYIKPGKGMKPFKSKKPSSDKLIKEIKAPSIKIADLKSKTNKAKAGAQATVSESKQSKGEQPKQIQLDGGSDQKTVRVVPHHGELNIDTQFIRVFKQKNLTAKSEGRAWFLSEEEMGK